MSNLGMESRSEKGLRAARKTMTAAAVATAAVAASLPIEGAKPGGVDAAKNVASSAPNPDSTS